MKYKVIWPHATTQKLAALYLVAKERSLANIVTKLLADVELDLESHPYSAGESREGNQRIFVETPLVIEFEVFDDEQVVIVFDLRLNLPKA